MDCSECSQLLTPYIKGHLEKPTLAEVQSHIESCDICRKDYEETRWLIDGIVKSRREIEAGHLSSMLLYDFAASRESIDKETIEMGRNHLATCDECARDFDRIKHLISTPMAGDTRAEETLPRVRFWNSIFGRRLVPVYSGIGVLAVAAIAVYFLARESPTRLVARIVTEDSARETGYEVYSLFSSRTARGADQDDGEREQEVSRRGSNHVILSMHVALLEDEGVSYEAVIRSKSGAPAWGSEVEIALMESGRLWLVLDRKALPLGSYEILLIEHTSDGYRSTVARSSFRIIE